MVALEELLTDFAAESFGFLSSCLARPSPTKRHFLDVRIRINRTIAYRFLEKAVLIERLLAFRREHFNKLAVVLIKTDFRKPVLHY